MDEASDEDAGGIEGIQARYIARLRAVAPMLRAWWDELVELLGEEGAFERWPTGPAGHPVMLHIFREASFEIEDHNEKVRESFEEPPDPNPEELWGEDDLGRAPRVERSLDWLVYGVEEVAPDLDTLVAGIVFVPIGLDQDEVSV